jgi:hypothetical protein
MVPLLQNSLSAWVTVSFWLLVAALPDTLMLAAQRRSFNHELFAAMRAAEHEDLHAQIAHVRRELRARHTDRLMPLDVRLAAAKPRPDASSEAESPPQATRPRSAAGDHAW